MADLTESHLWIGKDTILLIVFSGVFSLTIFQQNNIYLRSYVNLKSTTFLN